MPSSPRPFFLFPRPDTRPVKRAPFPDEFGVLVTRDIECMTCLVKRVRNGYVVKVFERKRFIEAEYELRVVDHEDGAETVDRRYDAIGVPLRDLE